MKTKIEIKSIFGQVLFEYEKENNSFKDTLVEAVKSGANLRDAYLRGANLRDAYLRGAYLRCAYLRGADLGDAYLRGAYLRCANLRGADLGDADLRGADLRGADLGDWGNLSSVEDILIVGSIGSRNDYTTIYHTDKGVFVQCGCFRGTLEEFSAKVKETHCGTKYERDYFALVEFAKLKFDL